VDGGKVAIWGVKINSLIARVNRGRNAIKLEVYRIIQFAPVLILIQPNAVGLVIE